MLRIWLASPKDKTVAKSIGAIVKQHKGLDHMLVQLKDNAMPYVEPGEVVLACGDRALKILQAQGLVPKNRTVTSLRGKEVYYKDACFLLTFDPRIIERDYGKFINIQWDTQLAIRRATTGTILTEVGKYRYVNDFSDAIQFIETKYKTTGKPVPVTTDLETVGLDEWNPEAHIVSISFTYKSGQADVIRFTGPEDPNYPPHTPEEEIPQHHLWTQIHWLLTCDYINLRGANLKFDMRWIKCKWGIQVSNFKMDTTLVGSLLDENRSNSLNIHAKIYTPIGGYDDAFNEKHDKSRMDLVPEDELLDYAGGDTDACYQIAEKMKAELMQDALLTRFYTKLLHPSSIAFGYMEEEGVLLDQEYYLHPVAEYEDYEAKDYDDDGNEITVTKTRLKRGLRAELETHIAECEKSALGQISRHILNKYSDNLSLTRAAILKEYMFTSPRGLKLKPKMVTAKTGEPSTAMAHLMEFTDHPDAGPFISSLKEVMTARKTLSTYVDGFLAHLRSDGRFHPTYLLFKGEYGGSEDSGTNSGRSSAKDPAVQCGRGSNLIHCKDGRHTLLSIIEGFEHGRKYQVKTHTGQWRDVVGVYRNGVRPVFEVKTQSGLVTGCTENHPLLLQEGFVRTDATRIGDLVYTDGGWHGPKSKAQSDGDDVSLVYRTRAKEGEWEDSLGVPVQMRRGEISRLRRVTAWSSKILRMLAKGAAYLPWAWASRRIRDVQQLGRDASEGQVYNWSSRRFKALCRGRSRSFLGALREFFGRHGRAAQWDVLGSQGQHQGVLQGQLSMGHPVRAGEEPREQHLVDLQGENPLRSGMGRGDWAGAQSVFQAASRVDRGNGPVDSKRAAEAGYVLAPIVSIRYVGDEETYDLTVDVDHSFVADGIVVHNTIPKHSKWAYKLRRGYVPPPGFLVVNIDFSQGELRVAACISKEANMIQAYKDGMDLHLITGGKVNGYSIDDMLDMKAAAKKNKKVAKMLKRIRQGGKAGNFGLLYGMGAKGFAEYARISYGVDMTVSEAEKAREAFFELYPGLVSWHEWSKNYAKQHGFIRSPLGRVRHLPLIYSSDNEMRAKAERQAINAQVQSTLSDIGQFTLVKFHEAYGRPDGCRPFMFCHDAVVFYIRESEADAWIPRCKELMGNLPIKDTFGWNHQIPFTVDVEVGHTFADMEEGLW